MSEWAQRTVSSLLVDASPGFASGEDLDEGTFQIRMNNVTSEGALDLKKRRRVTLKGKRNGDLLLKPGDVLFNSTNSPELVGKSALFPEIDEPATFSNHFVRLRPIEGALDGAFLSRWLHLQFQRGVFRGLCKQWVNQATVSRELLLALELPLPPVAEQRRIAAILDQADALRAKRREALAQLDGLTQSIFIEMFGDPRRAGATGSEPTKPRLLGELARIRTGKLDANAADEDGAYPFFTCAVKALRINTAAFDCKATLVAGNGDLNVKYYEGKFNAYQRTYVIESLNENLLVPRFLFAFLDLYVAELRKQAIGGVIKYIKLPYLTDAVMQVPDLKAQADFATRMVQVERIKSAQIQAAFEADALFASLQHRAFAGQLQ